MNLVAEGTSFATRATPAACVSDGLPSGAMSVSVVICAYTEDRWADLVAAVESVTRQSIPPLEIVLVIDHNEQLLRRATEHFRDIKVIENANLPGLSGARNAGIAASAGSIVAFLDDDAVATRDWIRDLLAGYGDERVFGVGGSVRPKWTGARPRWFPGEFEWVVGCTYRGVPTSLSPIRNLIGANMSFRRDVLVATGGFNNGIGQVGTSMLRCDDTEFCIRAAQEAGDGGILFQPAAVVYHSVPESRMTFSYYRKRCFTEGQAKVVVTRLVGARRGLSAEQNHALRTLPLGVLRGLTDTFARGDASGLARAGAIIVGLALAAAGYLLGSLSGHTLLADTPRPTESVIS